MRSKTSYFDFTVFKKTVLRFLPIWAGYTFIWLLLMPMSLVNNYRIDRAHLQIAETTQFGSVILPFAFGGICALAVFSYLYSQRSAVMFHSLPVSRGSLFISNYVAGLSFMIIPNLIIYGLTALTALYQPEADMQNVMIALNTWLGVTSLNCLFFYSFAVVLGMIVGTWFMLPVVYLILNFTATVVEFIITAGMELLVYGYSQGESGFTCLSPVAYMLEHFGFTRYLDGERVLLVENSVYVYLAILTAVAIIFTVVSYFIYKRRNVETAGEIISVKQLRPVFKYGFAIGCSIVIGAVVYSVIGFYDSKISLLISMIIGGVIGYLAATMAMNKSLRLKGKAWKSLAIFIAVIVILFTVFAFDLLGMEGYIPPKQSIVDATLWISGNGVSVSDGDISLDEFIDLHKQVLEQKEESKRVSYDGKEACTILEIYYETKNKTVERRYLIPIGKEYVERKGSAQNTLDSIINSFEYVSGKYPWVYDGSRILTVGIDFEDKIEYDVKPIYPTEEEKISGALTQIPYVKGDFKAILANPDARIDDICEAFKADILAGVYYEFAKFDSMKSDFVGYIEFTYVEKYRDDYLGSGKRVEHKVSEWIPIYEDSELFKICLKVASEEYIEYLKAYS